LAKIVFDVVVIGAGAAGLFCAATAARRGRRVLVLDHAAEPGAKILISGGGRCNFTNLSVKAENFLSANPHFAKSALAKFSSQDFIKLVEAHGIPYHEKRLGQLFCDDSARSILGMLLGLCHQNHVTLRLSQKITEISHGSGFAVKTGADLVEATSLVLATGGLSIPKLGATGFTYEIARQFGLAMTPVKPGLVPLRFEGPQWAWMQGLSGVSFESVARFGKREFREQALFTHRGLSGPALLQISSYLPDSPEAGELTLNMLPGNDATASLLERKAARPKAELKTILAELFPARLAQALLPEAQQKQIIAETSNKQLKELGERLNALRLRPTGTEGFAKAEVTVGGVDTAGLSSQTMGATKVPGLFVIGEAVDVTGWLGGYNFQWAWSSGFAAGEVA
jgi:predicted Rossmann fold flavoprotein